MFQAESALTLIRRNTVFNIPRAGININDGYGGGTELTQNLIFNSCRESSDHGTVNSWSRLPYITAVRDGSTPSSIPKTNLVSRNFFVSNYAADGGCVDNDDGTSYWHLDSNFCVYGGHKSDFDGHSKTSSNNLHIYPQVYGSRCIMIGAQALPPSGYAEQYANNTCVLPPVAGQATYFLVQGVRSGGSCFSGEGAREFAEGLLLASNRLFVQNGTDIHVTCGKETISFSDFQHKFGFDPTTAVSHNVPSPQELIAMAKNILLV